MSPIKCDIKVTVRLIPFEPDGSACHACGDTIFLEGRRAIFLQDGKKIGESEFRFCQSCGNALESLLKDGGVEKEDWGG